MRLSARGIEKEMSAASCKRGFRLALVLLLLCISGCGLAQDEVRVLLRRFQTDWALSLSLTADYTALDGNLMLRAGTALQIIPQEGHLILHLPSLSMDTGEQLHLRRASEGGVRFGEEAALFEGDLRLRNVQGRIVPVLSIDLETYVMGVLPYELGESFPIEALKAQAVAARSYALASRKPQADYDVTDDTDDQVYRGRDPANRDGLCERAVDQTRGIVGRYRGQTAICYYTASNGGQTEKAENVWPEPGAAQRYGYMSQRDDPYDLKNEQSPIRRAVLQSEKPWKSMGEQAHRALIESAASALMRAGLDPDADIRIERLDSLEATEPRFGGESRVYTTLRLGVTLSYPAPTANHAQARGTKALSLTIPFFGNVERELGLSINGSDNELLQVTPIAGGFLLETRRFGHGVGMSQRGAQEMARQGKDWREILAFYYPGLSLESLQLADSPLNSARPALLATPNPTPTPTPRPTLIPPLPEELEAKAARMRVNVEAGSSLNLREAPSLSAVVVRRLYEGQELFVLQTTRDGWSKVTIGGVEGYVRSEFLKQAP